MADIVTQKDIARKLTISRSHVSGVLAGNPRTGASEATRRLILETAQSLGYAPQAAGRMLQSGKTGIVSLPYVKPTQIVDSRNYAMAIQTIAEIIGLAGFRLDVKVYRDRQAIISWLPTMVQSRESDLVIFLGADDEVEEQAAVVEALAHPFIARGRHETKHPDWTQVDYDHEGMMRLAVGKAFAIGRRRIAYLGHDNQFAYSRHLVQGFLSAAHSIAGQVTSPEWVLQCDETERSRSAIVGRVAAWMDLPETERPTGLVCSAGTSCFAAIEMMLLERGMRIGDAPGEFTWVGALPPEPLIVGQAWRIADHDDQTILKMMAEEQLLPQLQDGRPRQRVISYLPTLVATSPSIFNGRVHLLAPLSKRG